MRNCAAEYDLCTHFMAMALNILNRKVGSPTYSRQNCMTLSWPWFNNLGLIFESTRFGLRDAPQKPWILYWTTSQCDSSISDNANLVKKEATLPNILSTGDSHRRAHNNVTENVKGLASLWRSWGNRLYEILTSFGPYTIKVCLIFEVSVPHKANNVEYWLFCLSQAVHYSFVIILRK